MTPVILPSVTDLTIRCPVCMDPCKMQSMSVQSAEDYEDAKAPVTHSVITVYSAALVAHLTDKHGLR